MNVSLESEMVSGGFSLIVAAVGLLGSIVVAFLTAYFTSKRSLFNARWKFSEMLYGKRYEVYKELISITHDIGKPGDISFYEKIRDAVREWEKKSGGFLLFSLDSYKYFGILKDELRKNPKSGLVYEPEQIEKLRGARNNLRWSLRSEFKMLFASEQKTEKLLVSWWRRFRLFLEKRRRRRRK